MNFINIVTECLSWGTVSLKVTIPSLFKNAGIYTISNVLNKAIPFLLLPVLTRFLTPEDYGITAMFGVLCSILTPLIGINAHAAFTRKYYSQDPGMDISSYVTNCLYVISFLFLIIGAISTLFRFQIANLMSLPSEWIFVASVLAFTGMIPTITLSSFQVREEASKYAIFNTLRTLINLSFSIIFVVVFLMGWQGRIISQILTSIIFMVLALSLLTKQGLFKLGKSFSSKDIKHLIHFGVPLIPHSLGAVINNVVDKLFITKMVGLVDTGLYSIGYQFGAIIGLFEEAFNRAFVPWLFAKLSKGEEQDKLKIIRFTYLYFVGIICIAGLLTLSSPFILKVMVSKDFYGAVVYVFWIALAYAFNGMYKMVVNYIFYVEKTYLLSIFTFSRSMLNIVLNYVLIQKNGPLGAAQATTISFFISFIVTWFISSRVYKMPWKEGFFYLFQFKKRSS